METPLAPIGGGLNESVPPSRQPQGTYQRGVNVRGIDARSGRVVWGAQRAGLADHGTLPSGHARHFAVASELVAAREFVELTPDDQEGVEPSAVSDLWTESIGERATAAAVGPDGQAYVLGESGDVVVLNPRGVESERIPSAAPNGFEAVRRVFVDEQGAVYTAATRSEQFEGGAGRVYRWVRDETGIWDATWTATIEGPIRTFVYRLGLVYIAEDGIETEEGETLLPALTRLSAPLLGSQVAWRTEKIAAPILDLAVTDRGQCVAASPASAARGGGAAAGFGVRSVDWTPPELVGWSENAWAWLDALHVGEDGTAPEDGDSVTLMRDRRLLDTDFDPVDEEIPERTLRALEPPAEIFAAPTWDESAFGGVGGLRFSGLAALVSHVSTSRTEPTEQQTIIPGLGERFTFTALIQMGVDQLTATDARQVLAQRQGDGVSMDLRLSTVNPGADLQLEELTTGAAAAAGSTTAGTRTALLSITSDGGTLRFFVDGDLAGTVASATTVQGGAFDHLLGPITVLGAAEPNYRSLARVDGTEVFFNDGGTARPDSRTRDFHDGSRFGQGRDLVGEALFHTGSGGTTADGIFISLPAGSRADSIGFWYETNIEPNTITVNVYTDATFTTISSTRTIDVADARIETQPGNRYIGAALGIDSAVSAQFIGVTADQSFRVREVELYDQGFGTASDAAEFALAEIVVYANDQDFERQQIEGYMAHRWGVQSTLLGDSSQGQAEHPFRSNPPTGLGSRPQDDALAAAALQSAYPVLAKYGTNGDLLAAYTGAGVGNGVAASGERVISIGDSNPGAVDDVPNHGTLVTSFQDDPRALTRTAGYASTERPADRRAPIVAGPRDSAFAAMKRRAGAGTLRRLDLSDMSQEWVQTRDELLDMVAAGAQVDQAPQGGAVGPEYLYGVASTASEQARRVDVLGLGATGDVAGRRTERLAVSSTGDLLAFRSSAWEVVAAGVLPGELPHSATLYGVTYFVDGVGYGAYEHATKRFRDFEEAVKGTLPPRCSLIAAYRGRMVLARGDNAFTLYFSEFGEPTNFDTGTEVETVTQAVSGTVAAQGRVPEPITALMPYRDDFLFVGTTESLYVLSGDLADGGRLDQVDRSQGVAFGYAWCASPGGIYYFSARGGVVLIQPGGGMQMVSSGAIQRRLEDIDLTANRVRMVYNWIDKTVHVYVVPVDLGSAVQHFVYEEPLQAWHVDDFGAGYANAITGADVLIGDGPDDRTLILAQADGRVRVWDQYADDDAGAAIKSSVLVGPLVSGTAGVEVALSGVHGVLDSDQGPVEVAALASNTADRPGAPGPSERMEPGRGYGVGLSASAPAVFLEVRGVGRPWAAHELRAELDAMGPARRVS